MKLVFKITLSEAVLAKSTQKMRRGLLSAIILSCEIEETPSYPRERSRNVFQENFDAFLLQKNFDLFKLLVKLSLLQDFNIFKFFISV